MLQQIQPVVEVKNPVADQVTVMTLGYFYAVDLGELIRPRHHRVAINGECTCILGRECPAVKAVRDYLGKGGERAKRPPYGYYPVIPSKCPVCHAPVQFDLSLSSPQRGAGCSCTVGGKSHYWQDRARIMVMRKRLARRAKNGWEV